LRNWQLFGHAKNCQHFMEPEVHYRAQKRPLGPPYPGPEGPILHPHNPLITNFVALSPRANYTDWSTATCRRSLVPTFVDRGLSRGQRCGPLTVVNLSFLDRSNYFSFK
jgi:hypothetical protein